MDSKASRSGVVLDFPAQFPRRFQLRFRAPFRLAWLAVLFAGGSA